MADTLNNDGGYAQFVNCYKEYHARQMQLDGKSLLRLIPLPGECNKIGRVNTLA